MTMPTSPREGAALAPAVRPGRAGARRVIPLTLALALATVLYPGGGAAARQPISLELPLDCTVGKTCWVSKFVDLDPGPGVVDYACTARANDGHNGTDLAVRDLRAMDEGVTVRAAAAGLVQGARDGMEDVSVRKKGRAALGGKDCGNGVIIAHDGGWTTQYCHMRQGSIRVKKGDRVKAGQELGLVGLSGNTEYPHMHLTVRKGDKLIDPFVGLEERAPSDGTCGLGKAPLWSPAARKALAYTPAAIFNVGFAEGPPDERDVRAGRLRARELPSTAPALIMWAEIFGIEPGDQLRMRLVGPDGKALVEINKTLEARKARWFQYVGKRRRASAWMAGRYQGEVSLTRMTKDGPQTTRVAPEVRLIAPPQAMAVEGAGPASESPPRSPPRAANPGPGPDPAVAPLQAPADGPAGLAEGGFMDALPLVIAILFGAVGVAAVAAWLLMRRPLDDEDET